MSVLRDKRIIVGVTGGIAAYKACEIVRRLREQNAQVRVVMTRGAQAFISPLSLQALSGQPVHTDLLDLQAEAAMGHIELARWADAILIAPASADHIAKLAAGMADELLSTLVLATAAPVFVAPAMNQQMYAAVATQTNLSTLRSRGISLLGPASGEQACGDVGLGRLLEPLQVIELLELALTENKVLHGRKVVITAGPTREAIDPVRYISNHSSGKMGYALASAAAALGADVTLVSGPVSLAVPAGVHTVPVTTASEMLQAVMTQLSGCDVFIACAAVADYRMTEIAPQKIKKIGDELQLRLQKNPDILTWVAQQNPRPFCVGFAAETERIHDHARSKLMTKNLDMICANDVSVPGLGFGSEDNALLVLQRDGSQQTLPAQSKRDLALALCHLMAARLPTPHF